MKLRNLKYMVLCIGMSMLAEIISCGGSEVGSIIVPGKNGKTLYGSAAMDGPRAYVTYYNSGAKELGIARSLDGGLTWKAADVRTVYKLPAAIRYAPVAVSGDAVFVLFRDARAETLRCARSMDGGATWKKDEICTVDGRINGGEHCALTVNGKEVYAAYNEVKTGILKFAVSRDLGTSWPEDAVRVVDATADSKGGQFISIAAAGRNVYIIYNGAYHGKGKGRSLRFARSADGGRTWNPADIRTVDGPECSLGAYGSLIVEGEKLYASYASKKGLMFARSLDGGAGWDLDAIRIVDKKEPGGLARDTALAVRGNVVCIAYAKQKGLWFARSLDGGVNWKKDDIRRLADTGESLLYQKVSMAASGDALLATYFHTDSSSIKGIISPDLGATWRVPEPAR